MNNSNFTKDKNKSRNKILIIIISLVLVTSSIILYNTFKPNNNEYTVGDSFTFEEFKWDTSNQRVHTVDWKESFVVFDVKLTSLKDNQTIAYEIKGINKEGEVFDQEYYIDDNLGPSLSDAMSRGISTDEQALGYVGFKVSDGVEKVEITSLSFDTKEKLVINLLPY